MLTPVPTTEEGSSLAKHHPKELAGPFGTSWDRDRSCVDQGLGLDVEQVARKTSAKKGAEAGKRFERGAVRSNLKTQPQHRRRIAGRARSACSQNPTAAAVSAGGQHR